MTIQTILFCLYSAFFFATWPLVMRASKLSPAVAGFMVHFVGAIIFAGIALTTTSPKPSSTHVLSKAVIIGVVAAILQACGHVFWQQILANRTVEIGTATLIMLVVLLVITAVATAIFFEEKFTLNKGAGFALGAIAIWLLVKK